MLKQPPSLASGRVRIVHVSELKWLLDGEAPQVAAEWDAEDGSDRHAWELPHERLEWLTNPGAAVRDRVIRGVLGTWDFTDPLHWETALARELDALPNADHARLLREEIEPMFRRFVATPVYRQLARASVCRRDVEYLVPLPNGSVLVRGILDCLWQDKAGNWHLLLHDTTGSPTGRGTKTGQLRPMFGALAVQAQFGGAPKTVRCYDWQAGKTSTWNERGQGEKLLAAVSRALADSAVRQPGADPSGKLLQLHDL